MYKSYRLQPKLCWHSVQPPCIVFNMCRVNQAARQWSAFHFYQPIHAKYPSSDFKNPEVFPGLIHQQILRSGCSNLHHYKDIKCALVSISINLKFPASPKLCFTACVLKQQDCNKNTHSTLGFTLLHVYTAAQRKLHMWILLQEISCAASQPHWGA